MFVLFASCTVAGEKLTNRNISNFREQSDEVEKDLLRKIHRLEYTHMQRWWMKIAKENVNTKNNLNPNLELI